MARLTGGNEGAVSRIRRESELGDTIAAAAAATNAAGAADAAVSGRGTRAWAVGDTEE
jgi:hypothetical protein